MSTSHPSKRLLLLAPTTGYQARVFAETARKLGLDIVFGTDRCHVLEDPWQDGALPLRFEDPPGSAQQIIQHARSHPLDAVVSIGDRPTPTAARAAQALGVPYHPPAAADVCRNKYLSRERLLAARLDVPGFRRFSAAANPREILRSSGMRFPCVLKPLALSASRGVIRADNSNQFVTAFGRIRALLFRPEIQVMREESSKFIQVEDYVEGVEVAVEGVVDRGRLRVLAVFDKPDPLAGPFFEETIYLTPSRLSPEVQGAVVRVLQEAVAALELYHGPVHAEFRLELERTDDSARAKRVWILEVAARSIGGLCSRALRFEPFLTDQVPPLEEPATLEEVIIRLALGQDLSAVKREATATGVMMIPIPRAGVYQGVGPLEEARRVGGVEEIIITAKPAQRLEPLPEGSSYLGFIFARGPSSRFTEQALRSAHKKLDFVIAPALPVLHPG